MPPPPKRPPPPPKKKKLFVKTASEAQIGERSRGALMGLAVGDALGATHEGRRLSAPMFPELCGGVYSDIVGGGPFKVRPGQVTDDTQMATCLVTGLRNLKRYDLFETAKEYARWVPHAFDIGPETK